MPHRRCRKSSAIFLCGVITLFFWNCVIYPVQGHASTTVVQAAARAKVQIETQIESEDSNLSKNEIIVNKGDTLSSLARKYKTSVAELVRLNKLTAPDKLRVGQKLLLKSSQEPSENKKTDIVPVPQEGQINKYEFVVEKYEVVTYNIPMEDSVNLVSAVNPENPVSPVSPVNPVSPEKPVSPGNSTISISSVSSAKLTSYPLKDKTESAESNSRGLGKIAQEDVELLARVIYAEARGEDFRGQVAVGAVVLNRLKDPHFPKTIREVIYQPGAFTAVSDKQIHLAPGEEAYRAAEAAIAGEDPTGGALYYYNPRTATDKWIKSRPVIRTIGNHTFSI